MAEAGTDPNTFLAFVGDSLTRAQEWTQYLSVALGWLGFFYTKLKKQRRRRRNQPHGSLETALHHELGAMSALSKSMERRAKRGMIDQHDLAELTGHINRANRLSRRLGLKTKDPDFEFRNISREGFDAIVENEPALTFGWIMLNRISYQSFKIASEL